MTKCVYRNCTEDAQFHYVEAVGSRARNTNALLRTLGTNVVLTILIVVFSGIMALIWLSHAEAGEFG